MVWPLAVRKCLSWGYFPRMHLSRTRMGEPAAQSPCFPASGTLLIPFAVKLEYEGLKTAAVSLTCTP